MGRGKEKREETKARLVGQDTTEVRALEEQMGRGKGKREETKARLVGQDTIDYFFKTENYPSQQEPSEVAAIVENLPLSGKYFLTEPILVII